MKPINRDRFLWTLGVLLNFFFIFLLQRGLTALMISAMNRNPLPKGWGPADYDNAITGLNFQNAILALVAGSLSTWLVIPLTYWLWRHVEKLVARFGRTISFITPYERDELW